MEHAYQGHGGWWLWDRPILVSTNHVQNSWFNDIFHHEFLCYLRDTRREISLKSFFRSSTGFFLGRGGTLAIFQMVGNRCSWYDALRIYVMGKARMSEYSFKSQFGMLSGPDALHWLRFAKTFWTGSLLTVKNLDVSSRGKWVSGSCNLLTWRGSRNAELMAFAWSGPERLENCSMFIRFNRSPFLDLVPLSRLNSSYYFLGFLPFSCWTFDS